MSPNSIDWRPGVDSNRVMARSTNPGPSPYARYAFVLGTLMAVVLLLGFYTVVSAAVSRSEESRRTARAEIDRKMSCGAFATASSRAVCDANLAHHAPPNAALKAAFVQPAWSGRRPELSARID
ncbi:MAG: hypothetical protein ABIV63_18035 [Caldimonas sp.]